jgi:hypothetical protein
VQLENGRDRGALAAYLLELAAVNPRLVVGLDFAFGFPAWWSGQNGWSHGREIWDAMSTTGEALLDACEPPFWGRPQRPRPHAAGNPLRMTDLAAGGTGPAKSVFQIGGAGAVGTGSVRGMAQLAKLSAAGFAVWPFDDDDGTRPVIIEIYPRRLTGPVNKSSWRARLEYLTARHSDQPELMLERAADPTVRLEGWIWTGSSHEAS